MEKVRSLLNCLFLLNNEFLIFLQNQITKDKYMLKKLIFKVLVTDRKVSTVGATKFSTDRTFISPSSSESEKSHEDIFTAISHR